MTRGAWFGLGAIVFMFAEPWLRRWLDHRPRPRRDSIEIIREDDDLRRDWSDLAETIHRNNTEWARMLDLRDPKARPPVRGQLLRPGRELDRGDCR